MVAVLLLAEGDTEVPRPIGGIAGIDELDPRHEIPDLDPDRHDRGRADRLDEITRRGTRQRRSAVAAATTGEMGRVEGDARLDTAWGSRPASDQISNPLKATAPSSVGVFGEESGSHEHVPALWAGGEIELPDEPFVEREIPGIAGRDELDGVGTRGAGVEIDYGAPGDHRAEPILEEPGSLGIDDQPELLFAAAIAEADADVPHLPRGSGFANSARA